jgi:uncharacterized protein
MSFTALVAVGFLFGIGFGYFIQRSGFCLAHGLGEIFIGKGKRISRMFAVIFIITAAGFLLSGYISPQLGLKTIGQIRGAGFYNLISGMFFGGGIFLCGGCILGTLRRIGEGNMTFLIVFISFIPGMALVVYGLNPLLEANYNVEKILLPELLGIAAPVVTGALIVGAIFWLRTLNRRR